MCNLLPRINEHASPKQRNSKIYFFFKKKLPCKQTENKGITAVTMIIKPQTCKSHRRKWWLLKCSILTKVQTTSNTEHIRMKQEPQQTSAHWLWNMTCSARARPPHAPALHRRTSFPQWGWRVQAASRAKHVHHRTNFQINVYKYVQISYRHLKCLWLE